MKNLLGFCLLLAASTGALAQVPSEADLFGGADPGKPSGTVVKRPPPPKSVLDTSSELVDKMQIGGRLEIRGTANKSDDQRFQQGSYTQNKTADLYFDTRPNKDTRAFFRLRFYEENNSTATNAENTAVTTTEKTGVSTIRESIDELWLKWDVGDTLFVTAGKQHVKWGRGRFWNPTDFTALEAKDPFAIFDRRLGQEMIKLHLPFEKSGHNLYAIMQFDDSQRNDDIGLALRGEFSVGENGETAISFQTKRGRPAKLGFDLGIGFGNFDVNAESAFVTRDTAPRFEGDLDLQRLVFPTTRYDDKKVYNQSVLNLEYVVKYNDEDSVNFGVEGFWNQLGYDDRLLEFYSLVQNQSKVLYSGQQYFGAYTRLAGPGTWNDSSFILNAVQNISDRTALLRLTGTYTFYKQITAEAYVSRCFGEYGELCFRVPDKILAGSVVLPPNLQAVINALPKRTVRAVVGGSLSMSF